MLTHSSQVEFLTDAQRRLQSELETRDAKIAEVQNQKAEIFDKMVQVGGWRRRPWTGGVQLGVEDGKPRQGWRGCGCTAGGLLVHKPMLPTQLLHPPPGPGCHG